MSAHATGTQGQAPSSSSAAGGLTITGQQPWTYAGPDNNIYQTEHDELFASIRNGKPINNGEYMAKSTLLAIMGRMATYTGQEITWEQAMNSKEDLTPPKYEWGPLPAPPVAMPGRDEVRLNRRPTTHLSHPGGAPCLFAWRSWAWFSVACRSSLVSQRPDWRRTRRGSAPSPRRSAGSIRVSCPSKPRVRGPIGQAAWSRRTFAGAVTS